jgi:hypothetical protein
MHGGIGIRLALGIMDIIHEPCTDWTVLSGVRKICMQFVCSERRLEYEITLRMAL